MSNRNPDNLNPWQLWRAAAQQCLDRDFLVSAGDWMAQLVTLAAVPERDPRRAAHNMSESQQKKVFF